MLALPLAALVVMAALAEPARAQDRAVYPGDRVRVTTDRTWTGMVQAVMQDSLRIIDDDGRVPQSVPVGTITALDVSIGPKSRGPSFVIGGLGGAVLAGAIAAVISAGEGCDNLEVSPTGGTPFCEQVGPVAVVAFTTLGFAVGGAVGAFMGGGDRWVRAALPQRVGLRLEPDRTRRVGLGLRIATGF